MTVTRYRRFVATAAVAAALLTALAPTTAAEPRFACLDVSCALTVENNSPCGLNQTIEGQTCVRRLRVVARYSPVPAQPNEEFSAALEHEDAMGEVRAWNTENAWTSDRDHVSVRASNASLSLDTSGYLSASRPGTATAGQLDRRVLVDANETIAGSLDALPPLLAGGRVRVHNNDLAYCTAYSPSGDVAVPCSLTPLFEILP